MCLGSDGWRARKGMVASRREKKGMKNLVWSVVDLAMDNQT